MSNQYQVAVGGAGAAGLCAAISAARNGAKTILVDYNGFLGGLSTMMPWLGFHDREYRLVVKGLGLEMVRRLQSEGAASEFCYDPKCGSAVGIDNSVWKCLAVEMVQEAGVNLLMQTQVVGTIRHGDRIGGIIIENKSGRSEITADHVIDCSGDGDVAARGGVAFQKGRESDGCVQTPSLACRFGGIDHGAFLAGCRDKSLCYRQWVHDIPEVWDKTMARLDRMPMIVLGGFTSLVQKAKDNGEFDVPQSHVVGVHGPRPDELTMVMSRVYGVDPTDARSLTDAYVALYGKQVRQLLRFFRKYIPGCKDCFIMEIGPILGVRESRRIVGDYMLNAEDLVSGRRFEDTVCMGAFHIDIHRPTGFWTTSKNVKAYGIPLRCMVAAGVEGLMMAGKCLSGTHEAHASSRVVPTCMGMGQAAGTAAAMAAARGISVRELKIGELQELLTAQGAELGHTLGEPNQSAIDEAGQLPLD